MNPILKTIHASIVCSILLLTAPARAQTTPDTTLGNEASRLTPNQIINGASADRIDGGAQRGINLFHSFSQFNIGNGQRVYFANPVGVQNILTRVTGTGASNILGTLGVDGIANLFLINPNGILFGKNASLDVRGSFVGTTANGVKFEEQGIFDVGGKQAPSLLTVNPSAFLFNQINSGAITNNSQFFTGFSPWLEQSFGLRVGDGKNLQLIGGNINIDNGRLNAYGGRVDIAAIAGVGEVGINLDGSLTVPDSLTRAEVSLNQSWIDVRGNSKNNIGLTASNINSERSYILAGIAQSQNTDRVSGDILISATGSVQLDDGAIANQVLNNTSNNGGNIFIDTGLLSLTNGAQLDTSVFGKGYAGDITVNARNHVLIEGFNQNGLASTIFTEIVNGASGNGGDININTGTLSVINGGSLVSNTRGQGNAGNIFINARETVTFSGWGTLNTSGAYSRVTDNAAGEGGNIEINTGSFSLTNAALIVTSTSGKGSAGNVIINARERVLLNGTGSNKFNPSYISSSVSSKAGGDSGDICITTGSLEVLNGSQLYATTRGQGNAGNIVIQSSNDIVFNEGIALTTIFERATGIGGNIEITGGSLILINEAILRTGTDGNGNSGNVKLNVNDSIFLDTSSIYSNVSSKGFGNGGNIEINAQSLKAINESQIVSSTSGTGNGGNIKIDSKSLSLTDGAQIVGVTRGNGDAGKITVNADSITLDGKDSRGFPSGIFANTLSDTGRSGSIAINTNSLQLRNTGKINATTTNNLPGGDIDITANQVLLSTGGQIATTTYSEGKAGNIRLNVTEKVTLTNAKTGLFADTTNDSSGDGGNIFINLQTLNLSDQAQISVGSEGTGRGGDIEIQASKVNLSNSAQISAQTRSNDGGNISLKANDILLMRFGSNISATAGLAQGTGNGGNININADAIVAVPRENSDIRANAFEGRGGNVTINTDGLFGIAASRVDTFESNITASSELGVQGQIAIAQPDVDPTQGILELPTQVVDVSNQIGQLCPRGELAFRRPLNQFIVTGRGSLPPNPLQPMPGRLSNRQLATLESNIQSQQALQRIDGNIEAKPASTIVEAQGWIKNADGTIALVAVPTATPSNRPSVPTCPVSS